jgi:hypothetical protein
MVKYYYENLLSNQNLTATTNIAWVADITTLRLFRDPNWNSFSEAKIKPENENKLNSTGNEILSLKWGCFLMKRKDKIILVHKRIL